MEKTLSFNNINSWWELFGAENYDWTWLTFNSATLDVDSLRPTNYHWIWSWTMTEFAYYIIPDYCSILDGYCRYILYVCDKINTYMYFHFECIVWGVYEWCFTLTKLDLGLTVCSFNSILHAGFRKDNLRQEIYTGFLN